MKEILFEDLKKGDWIKHSHLGSSPLVGGYIMESPRQGRGLKKTILVDVAQISPLVAQHFDHLLATALSRTHDGGLTIFVFGSHIDLGINQKIHCVNHAIGCHVFGCVDGPMQRIPPIVADAAQISPLGAQHLDHLRVTVLSR